MLANMSLETNLKFMCGPFSEVDGIDTSYFVEGKSKNKSLLRILGK